MKLHPALQARAGDQGLQAGVLDRGLGHAERRRRGPAAGARGRRAASGAHGAGTPELTGVGNRVDLVSGTMGKALGGASGGYIAGRSEIVALLRQRARPYLFSNSVPPTVVGATRAVLSLLRESDGLRKKLANNTALFRSLMTEAGFDLLPGETPIVPVMFGDAVAAAEFAQRLLEHGVYAVAFSYPVVPMGKARIRTQVSAAHSEEDIRAAAAAFIAARG